MGGLHIRYLATGQTLCDNPSRLDEPGGFVVADYARGINSCKDCSAILFAHNKKSYDKEILEIQNTVSAQEYIGDAKWIVIGAMAVTSGFWIGLFLMLWWLLYG